MRELYQFLGVAAIFGAMYALDIYAVNKLRQLAVRILYLAAFDEACDSDDGALIRARCKTPSLQKFRKELDAFKDETA